MGFIDMRFCKELAVSFAVRAEMESKSSIRARGGDRLVGIDFEIRRELRYVRRRESAEDVFCPIFTNCPVQRYGQDKAHARGEALLCEGRNH